MGHNTLVSKIIHTSDWHLGQRLEGQDRADEQQAFLDWLLTELERLSIDALLVCGDIFDVANPPIEAVRMLYGFLARARRNCSNIILVAGNHDSAARLDAMGFLAAELGITIVGGLGEDPADRILPLLNGDGDCFARVAAIPYLRPSDLTAAAPDEDVAAQHGRVLSAIEAIYGQVLESAKLVLKKGEALVVTGHLFARGGTVSEGERAAHVEAGNLLAVPTGIFGRRTAYVALGHLHRAQRVAKQPPSWYCGTPIPLSFGEAKREQSVQVITLDGGAVTTVESIPVPRVRELHDVEGERDVVFGRLEELVERHPAGSSRAWLRVKIEEREPDPGVREAVREAIEGSSLHLLAVRRCGLGDDGALADMEPERRLDELSPESVFEILHQERFGEPPGGALTDAFATLLQEVLTEEDEA